MLASIGHKPAGLEGRVSEFRKQAGEPLYEKWRFHCECGYTSTFVYSQKVAVQDGIHHMRKTAKEYRANGGVSLHGNTASAG